MSRKSVTSTKTPVLSLENRGGSGVKRPKRVKVAKKSPGSSQGILGVPGVSRKLTAGDLRVSFDAWATAIGREVRTAQRIFVRNGATLKGSQEIYTAREFFDGMMGEELAEKIRNLRADADRKEREEAEATGKLVEWDRVEQRLNQRVYLPLLSALDAAPSGVSQEWVEKVLKPILRQKVETPGPPERK